MKVIALLDCPVGAGGGFDQAFNAVLQMQRLCANRFEYEVWTTTEQNIVLLKKLKISGTLFKYKKIDRLFERWASSSLFRRIQSRLKFHGPLERRLISKGCDIVYLVTPNQIAAAFQTLAYVTTLWDLCHRDQPEFPEVRSFSTFHAREQNYMSCLPAALLVLTDSERLSERVCRRYGIDPDRVLAMPYASSPLAATACLPPSILSKYQLDEGYFLYPAQFWPHKNHIRILQALQILKSKYGWMPKVVFLGKDQGNLLHLRRYIEQHDLASQVCITGFVPFDHMEILYTAAVAVVMPTYFGPTNIPPLEAWKFNKPLIYSAHLSEQVGDAALLINPDSEDELAEAMRQSVDPIIKAQLIKAGHLRLIKTGEMRQKAEEVLVDNLQKYAKRRECWA